MGRKTGRTKEAQFQTTKPGRTKIDAPKEKKLKRDFSINNQLFKWSLESCVWEHAGWVCAEMGIPYFAEHVVKKLKDYETQTWQAIQEAAGGKSKGNGSNNHYIPGINLPKNERVHFIRENYMRDFEKVFSLRLMAKERLIGIVDGSIFRILWYDPDHKFFPSTH